MATTTEVRSAGPPPAGKPVGAGRGRPVRGFELWTWLFMRISGIVLLFLAVGHVLIMHVFDEGVDRVDFAFIQLRWASPFWKTWDWLLLVLALLHGVNGLRVIVLDYVRPAGLRLAINTFFTVLGAALMALGTIVVVTFDPSAWPTGAGSP
jgi:succinate dehydrogenase / fumarate reductase, membrane anchor subunit